MLGPLLGSFLLSFLLVVAPAAMAQVPPEEPAQLNTDGFGTCLTEVQPVSGIEPLAPLATRYDFSGSDGFLIYLALYPGKYLPIISETVQKPALQRWSGIWNTSEADLAERLAAPTAEPWTPSRYYAEALGVCHRDIFCAALMAHNVLRTLGRHDDYHAPKTTAVEDRNPQWFRSDPKAWEEKAAAIQGRLISLRRDGGGDRWGEWYHFWGILAFALHEASLGKNPGTIDFVASMNQILNPGLAGGAEDAAKARLDRDSAKVAQKYLNWEAERSAFDCQSRSAYVQSGS